MKVNGPSCQAATAKTKPENPVPIQAVRMDIEPVIRGRSAVLGLRASIQRSAMRLEPIARVLAATMAIVIQKNWYQVGQPLAANSMPKYANGKAKMVCSNFMKSRNSRAAFIKRL